MTNEVDFTKRNPNCVMCELHPGGSRAVANTCCIWGEGPVSADIMIVGLGPGANEDKKGQVFIGKAGQMLNDMLNTLGLPRKTVYITNAVKCRPKDNAPLAMEIRLCYNYLQAEIEKVKPKVIIAVGHVAWQAIQGKKCQESMEKQIGKVYRVNRFPGTKLMVAIHPAAVLRNRNNEKKYVMSWVAVRKYLDGKLLDPMDLGEYTKIYNPREALVWLQKTAQAGHFSFDFETGFDESTVDVAWINSLNDKFMEKAALRWEFPGFFLKSISFCINPREAFAIPFNYPVTAEASRWYWKPEEEAIIKKGIVALFTDPKIKKNAHNINYDRHTAEEKMGCPFRGELDDTMLMHFLLWDFKPHNLEDIAWEQTKIGDYTRQCDEAGGIQRAHGDALLSKNLVDSDITERLRCVFPPMLKEDETEKLYRNVIVPGLDALYHLEKEGFPVDLERWNDLNKKAADLYKEKRDFLVNSPFGKQVEKELGVEFNPNSDDHLRHLFFNIQKQPVTRLTEKTKKPSVNEEVLSYLDEEQNAPLARDILMYNKVAKMKSTYIDGMRPMVAPDGRIHARYNLHIARTGRTSSDNPNLQNIPRGLDERKYIQELLKRLDVREVFVSPPGWVLAEYDFNQHELRVTAMASHDPILTDAYRADPAKDIHSVTASGLCERKGYTQYSTYESFIQAKSILGHDDLIDKIRRDAKVLNFGVIYGKTVNGVMRDLKCEKPEAQEYFDGFWELYAGVKAWKEREEQNVMLRGYTVSLLGQKRRFPWSRDWQARKQGVNHIIQNTASQLMIIGLVNFLALKRKYGFKTTPCAEVHDSILFLIWEPEFEKMKQVIPQVLENPAVNFLHVPLKVDHKFGTRWSKLK